MLAPRRASVAGGVVLDALTVLLIGLGVYPTPFMHIIATTVARLSFN
jgi:NADH:ubiquinone oxidoreductase subunit 4 (subunit M)